MKAASKKRKKSAKKAVLSFGNDEDEGDNVEPNNGGVRVKSTTPAPAPTKDSDVPSDTGPALKKRLKPNATVSFQPKAVTKSALLRETQLKEQLRKEYMQLQEAVKQTEFCLPFVFFDGKNAPGGMCRIKKGDFIWLFLEQARKVGAGIGGARMKDWARIGVDDLMVVRGDLIIPHVSRCKRAASFEATQTNTIKHYDFHHFLVNRTVGYDNTPIFNYSAEPTSATPKHLLQKDSNPDSNRSIPQPDDSSHITTAAELARQRQVATESRIPDSELEGFSDDPALTRVVDRRWYERNKHIYPASVWEDLDPTKDYSKDARKDVQGNAFFFSR